MVNGKNRKGQDRLRRLQESKVIPNVFVVVPLHDDHPPIVDLNVQMDLTPSKPF
jgi:hypothetical protein